MKNMKHILSIFLMSLLMHCQEDPKPKTELEKLPPATQSGKGTFGCLVDGRAWVTELISDASAYYQTGTLFISAGLTTESVDHTIVISLQDNNLTTKEYALTGYPLIFGRLTDKSIGCQYTTSNSSTGKLVITNLNKSEFVISGTFEFQAFSPVCNRVIFVTDGRFDIEYAP